MIGDTCLQGPHQSAQKSTITGLSDFSTTSLNVASVTSLTAPMESPLLHFSVPTLADTKGRATDPSWAYRQLCLSRDRARLAQHQTFSAHLEISCHKVSHSADRSTDRGAS